MLPSIRALAAFEAAGRLESFTLAAQELGMTQSAISHQIRSLEDQVGQPLFNRLHRSAVLTDAGRDLQVTIQDCFLRLEAGLKRLDQYKKPNQVIVCMPPSLAGRWLMPRLDAYHAENPGHDVWLHTTNYDVDIARGEFHVVVCRGRPTSPDIECWELFSDPLTAFAAPDLIARTGAASPADLLGSPLLHDERREDWALWFGAAGISANPVQGYNFSDSGMLLEAAVAGFGFALGSMILAAPDVDAGRLAAPFPDLTLAGEGYFACISHRYAGLEKVRKFRRWLDEEAARTRAWVETQAPNHPKEHRT